MTNLSGMDLDAVRGLARDLETQAQQIQQIIAAIQSVIGRGPAIWKGQDFDQFQDWWQNKHRAELQAIAERVHGLGQSAANNASSQEHASGGAASGGAHMTGPVHGGPAHTPPIAPVTPTPVQGGELPGTHRTWEQVQQDYAGNAKWLGSYGPGGAYEYQCTAWANNRWHELGYTGPPIGGDGHQMAGNVGGSVDTVPHPGAMASTGGGHNHVMIAEEITPDGNRIRFSEMNTGTGPAGAALHDGGESWQTGEAQEFKGDSWFTKQSDGTWHRDGSRGSSMPLIFANIPGK